MGDRKVTHKIQIITMGEEGLRHKTFDYVTVEFSIISTDDMNLNEV